jgi:hypothetical protein
MPRLHHISDAEPVVFAVIHLHLFAVVNHLKLEQSCCHAEHFDGTRSLGVIPHLVHQLARCLLDVPLVNSNDDSRTTLTW